METLDKPKERSNSVQNKTYSHALHNKVKHKITNKKAVITIDN